MKRWLCLFLVFLLFTACQEPADYLFLVTDERQTVEETTAEMSAETTVVTETVPSFEENASSNETEAAISAAATVLPEVTVTGSMPPEVPASSIILLSVTETVKRGSEASLTIRGKPGVTYSIQVFYATTESTAKGLEPKIADENGFVTWRWRVGSRTKAGSHKIQISGDGDVLTLSFTTTV